MEQTSALCMGRNYMPGVGLWLARTRLAQQLGEPLAMPEHPYTYAYNNPVNYIDPTGNVPVRVGGAITRPRPIGPPGRFGRPSYTPSPHPVGPRPIRPAGRFGPGYIRPMSVQDDEPGFWDWNWMLKKEGEYLCCFVHCYTGFDLCKFPEIFSADDFKSLIQQRGFEKAIQTIVDRQRHRAFIKYIERPRYLPPQLAARRLANYQFWKNAAKKVGPAMQAASICQCTYQCYRDT